MKILIDKNYKKTKIETDSNLELFNEIRDSFDSLEITSTPLITFSKYTEVDLLKEIDSIEREDILPQFNKLRDFALKREDIFIKEYPDFIKKIQKFRFDINQYQKVTYQVEDEESFDEIYKAILLVDSYALFRAVKKDIVKREIVVYVLRSGFWQVDGNLYIRKLDARSGSSIRTQFTKRFLTDLTQMNSDLGRSNFPIYEDLKFLFDLNLIKSAKKSIEDENGEYIDDPKKNYVIKEHFVDLESSVDEQKEIELAAKIKEQKKLNSSSTTIFEVKSSLEKNRNKIHTDYDRANLNSVDEVLKNSKDIFLSNQIEDFKKAQEEALELFEATLKDAVIYEKECYKEYFDLIESGATFDEAKNILKSRKFLERSIMFAEERLKADIVKFSKIDLVKYNNYDRVEKANRTNYKNYIEELNKRKALETELREYKQIIFDQKEVLKLQDIEIRDFKNEITRLQGAFAKSLDALEQSKKELKDIKAKLKENSKE
jgi:hypothetical protein